MFSRRKTVVAPQRDPAPAAIPVKAAPKPRDWRVELNVPRSTLLLAQLELVPLRKAFQDVKPKTKKRSRNIEAPRGANQRYVPVRTKELKEKFKFYNEALEKMNLARASYYESVQALADQMIESVMHTLPEDVRDTYWERRRTLQRIKPKGTAMPLDYITQVHAFDQYRLHILRHRKKALHLAGDDIGIFEDALSQKPTRLVNVRKDVVIPVF